MLSVRHAHAVCVEGDADDLVSRLATAPRAESSLPLSGSLELTERCNLGCTHCYLCRTGDRRDLTTTETVSLLDKLADAGVLVLVLTGGEPLMRDDFAAIWHHAKSRGFLLTLFTNATLVNDEVADLLRELPPRRIEVSIYGMSSAVYEKVTGRCGSHIRFRQGVSRLMERGLPVRLKYLVTSDNAHELSTAQSWAREIGAPFRYDWLLAPRLNGDSTPLARRISVPETVSLLAADPETFGGADGQRPSPGAQDGPARLFTCGAGVRTFHVDAHGFLHPCLLWRWSPYNLRTGTPEGWFPLVQLLRSAVVPSRSECLACPQRVACPACPALSRSEVGTAGMPVAYYCSLADLLEGQSPSESAAAGAP